MAYEVRPWQHRRQDRRREFSNASSGNTARARPGWLMEPRVTNEEVLAKARADPPVHSGAAAEGAL